MKHDKRNITAMVMGMVIGAALVSEAAAGIVAEPMWQKIYVDGQQVYMTACNIAGNNFVRLRDIGQQMRHPQNTAYDNCLQDMTSRIQDTVQEIYEDLRKHIGIIRYIPKDDRENLIKVLLGLADICKMASTSNVRSDDCVSILNLSDYDTYPKSRIDDREIEEAAEIACGTAIS